jgi:hypothetical protein
MASPLEALSDCLQGMTALFPEGWLMSLRRTSRRQKSPSHTAEQNNQKNNQQNRQKNPSQQNRKRTPVRASILRDG